MILTCLCGPAIEVLHTQSGLLFARQFGSFQQSSDGWVDRGDGEMRRQVYLECTRCDSSLLYYESESAAGRHGPRAEGVVSRLRERCRALLGPF